MNKISIFILLILLQTIYLTVFAQNSSVLPKEFAGFLQEAEAAEQEMNATNASAAYEKAISFYKNKPFNFQNLPDLYYKYGSMLIYSGNYAKAIDTLTEAIEINKSQAMPDKTFEARTYMQFGILHFFQEQWDDALFYYEKAKKEAEELKNEQGISIAENNIANIHQKKGNFKEAIEGYERCLALQSNLKDSATISNSYFNLGTCYEELKQPEIAENYLKKALETAKAINDVEIYSLSLIHLAKTNLNRNEINVAESQLNEAEEIIQKSGYQQVLTELYKVKADLFEQKGDYKTALEILKINHSISDSIADEKLKMRTKELTVKFQSEEKEMEIALQKEKIKSKNSILLMFSIFSLFALVLIFTLYQMWRKRQAQNKELIKVNRTKDKLFSIISHDLKSPLIAQKVAIDSLAKKFETHEDKDVKSYFQIMQDNAGNQLEIIENLTNWAKAQTNKFEYSPQSFEIASVIEEELKLYTFAAQNKSITFDKEISKNCIVFADKQMIAIVLRNLINNAVKFSKENQRIRISCNCENQKAKITIADEGIGFSQEQIEHFNSPGQNLKVRFGTKGEKGTGLGLALCKELLAKNKSKLQLESKENEGAQFYFLLDKSINGK